MGRRASRARGDIDGPFLTPMPRRHGEDARCRTDCEPRCPAVLSSRCVMTRAAMLDPTQLESFLAVARTRNFTEAGRRLGLQQSTISQHIRKLEAAAGRRLFVRDTHSVRLTANGEPRTGFAQSIVDVANRARRYFAGSRLRGRLRFGTSEDFVSTRLPELLRDFVRQHALVALELKVGV